MTNLDQLTDHERRKAIAVAGAKGCSNPIRLTGAISVTDQRNGFVLHRWSSAIDEPNGVSYVPCKTRRADKCESCARLYQGDAFRLIVNGLRGGEFVDESVKDHPALFVTFTAPSFGVVHRHACDKQGNPIPCHPRRGGDICPHGVDLDCKIRHAADDYRVGQAICKECFDYDGAVTWNHFAGKLWRQTRIEIDHELARLLGTNRSKMRKQVCRTQYIKIAEFQRRGLVHFHIAIRLDGPDGEFPRASVEQLIEAVQRARNATVATFDDARISWGTQLDIKVIGTDIEREQLAGYFAKYATKRADAKGLLNSRVRDERQIDYLPINDHQARLVRAAWRLGNTHDDCTAARWAHQFGFGGHFLTKSRETQAKDGTVWLGWSTTFKALRQRRADHNAEIRQASWQALSPQAQLAIESRWSFAGTGFATETDSHLADLQRAQTKPTTVNEAA